MAPPTTIQNGRRMDKLEGDLAALKISMAEEITEAVNKASTEVQQAVANQIAASLEQVSQILEGRISRSREGQEAMIAKIREDQLNFQAEVRQPNSERRVSTTPQSELLGGLGSTSHGGIKFGFRSGSGVEHGGGGPGGGHGGTLGGGGNWKYRSWICHCLTEKIRTVGF